jgi:competence protein ComEA
MFKKLITVIALLCATSAFALDVNKASPAELEAVKGIGPGLATKITAERQKSSFKDWQDLVTRVNGVGENNAAKFSTEGLTVNGAAFAGAPAAAPKAAKTSNAAAKSMKAASAVPASMEAKPAAVTAAPAVLTKKMDDKMAAPVAVTASEPAAMSKADKKAASKKAKEEKKAAKAAAAASAVTDKAKQ